MSRIQRTTLSLGTQIGQGGQGTVYPVAGRKINSQWDTVYKEYAPGILPQLRADALTGMADLIPDLPAADARWLCEKTAWPAGVVESGGRVTGFLMRAVPEEFQFHMRNIRGAGTSRRLAGLEFLLNPDSYVGQIGLRISQRDRLLLLADIAATISRMHSMDIVIGDLSPKNLLLSTAPVPGCFFIDCDAMRLRGTDALPQVETPGWQVPAGEQPGTRASDAYKLALLATRVVARDQDAADPAVLTGVSPALGDLARRGLGPDPAQRPAPADWAAPLRTAADSAATAYTAPSPRPIPIPIPIPRPPAGPGIPASIRATWGRQRRAARAVLGAIAAVLLLIVGLSVSGAFSSSPANNAAHQPSTSGLGPPPAPTDTGSEDVQPTDTYTPPDTAAPSPAPSPTPTDSLAGAAPGDCYTNTSGSAKYANWHADPGCEDGSFKVVQVVSDTTDMSSCDNVSGSDWKTADLQGNQVLCMMYQDSSPAFAASPGRCVFGAPGSGSIWDFTSCNTGSFTVVDVYTGTTDSNRCGSDSDEAETYTVSDYPSLDEVQCLEMNFPLVGTVRQYACLWESNSGSGTTFSTVSSCDEANAVLEGRIMTPDDPSWCGRWASYWWSSKVYPNLGFTACLGAPNLPPKMRWHGERGVAGRPFGTGLKGLD